MFDVFTPARARSTAEERTAKDALRAKGLADITTDLLEEKKAAEDAFEDTMRRQRDDAAKWFAENFNKKKALEAEVLALEQRKKDALMPLTSIISDIQFREETLLTRASSLEEKEAENMDESRALMLKLDAVSSREQSCVEREARVKRMEQGAEMQRQQIANSAKNLGKAIAFFEKEKMETEARFAFRASTLQAQESLNEEKAKGLVVKEKEIKEGKIRNDDQRVLLQQGFDELRKNEHLPRQQSQTNSPSRSK